MFENAIPCIVELFGHQRIAGKVSEESVGGQSFVRVDVPEVEDQKAFTKLYGANAIYAITPVSEETMLRAVRAFQAVPIEAYHLSIPTRAAIAAPVHDDDDDDYNDDDEFDSEF